MDEFEWKKLIKKSLIFMLLAIWMSTGLLGIFGLLGFILSPQPVSRLSASVPLLIAIALSVFILAIYGVIFISYKILNRGKPLNPLIIKEYQREIPTNYPPAILSLVHDLKTDVFRDYSATILFLCNKKYLKLVSNADKYDFEILKTENELLELSKHEKYVFNCIANKIKFNENEFTNLILEDAYSNGLLTKKKQNSQLFYYILYIVILIVLIIIKQFFLLYVFVMGGMCSEILKMYYPSKTYKRTITGKELTKKAAEIKKFLKDYTLIQEKDIEHINLLDEYIPYALSLNEADSIDEFIKNNEQYRYLIYQSKFNL